MGNLFTSVKYTEDGIPYHTLSDFKDMKRINSGTYGIIYKGYGTVKGKKREVAVKSFNETDTQSEREIQILKTHSHPNIIELFGVIWDGDKDDLTKKPLFAGYVMEYMKGGSLHNEIYNSSGVYDVSLVILWTQQIALGLQYLHDNNIIHRDIKPKNILLATRTHIKLGDFGLARNVSGSNRYTSGRMGTDFYMAPEVVEISKDYGTSADIFSFGVTIWEIVHRKHPSKHMMVTQEGKFLEIPIDSTKMDAKLTILVKRCCQINSSNRPPIKNIVDYIKTFYQSVLTTITESNYNEAEEDNSNNLILDYLLALIRTFRISSSLKYTPDGVPYHTFNDFKELRRLDAGRYGIAYKGNGTVKGKTRDVAVKIFSHLDEYSEREIRILKTHSHSNIIELFGVIWDGNVYKDNDLVEKPIYTGYVMEYMELGSLHHVIHDGSNVYDIALVVLWNQQIGLGLQYLHGQGVIHRDVKPKNILLAAKDHLKLAEFSLARNVSFQNTNTSGVEGTNPYAAPEVIKSNNYGPPADVFSFGITIWEIVHRKHPWNCLKFDGNGIDLPIDSNKMDEDLSALVTRCLLITISDRPSLKEIIDFEPKLDTILVKKNLTIDFNVTNERESF